MTDTAQQVLRLQDKVRALEAENKRLRDDLADRVLRVDRLLREALTALDQKEE